MRWWLALILVVVPPLAAQSVRARLEGRIPNEAVPGVDSVIQVASGEGLPTEPLIQKALEGGAKRVAAPRITAAVAATLDQLRGARALLARAGSTPPIKASEVTTVAWALRRGLPEPLVERIVAALKPPRAAAIHAVADLALHNFNVDSAADLIIAAVSLGLHGERLLDVSAAAQHELQRGHTRAEALALVRAQLPNIPNPPRPAASTVGRARRVTPATPPPPP